MLRNHTDGAHRRRRHRRCSLGAVFNRRSFNRYRSTEGAEGTARLFPDVTVKPYGRRGVDGHGGNAAVAGETLILDVVVRDTHEGELRHLMFEVVRCQAVERERSLYHVAVRFLWTTPRACGIDPSRGGTSCRGAGVDQTPST